MEPKFPYITATAEIIGINITSDDKKNIKDITEIASLIKSINTYLEGFCVAKKDRKLCPNCHEQLGGLLGNFKWGMLNGSGNCGSCHWPCKAYHDIKDEHEKSVFQHRLVYVLPIHPKYVSKK